MQVFVRSVRKEVSQTTPGRATRLDRDFFLLGVEMTGELFTDYYKMAGYGEDFVIYSPLTSELKPMIDSNGEVIHYLLFLDD